MQLRQQARAGTIYAPGLSYAPVSRDSVTSSAVAAPDAATAGVSTATMPRPSNLSSTDEVTSPEQEACRDVLREGKRLLRSQQGMPAQSLPQECPQELARAYLAHGNTFFFVAPVDVGLFPFHSPV